MNEFVERSLLDLNDCECCEGVAAQTPVKVHNRDGLSEIARRVGVYGQFKNSMLAQLSSSKLPALKTLTSREKDDFAIALLYAFATVADVLTFYQERIANESYLRTATEPFSLLQLARLIGYELRPGVAASTHLTFTLDTAPGSPNQTTIEAGTKVQSLPGPNEQAQMFETVEPIEARVAWNAIKPRLLQPQTADSLSKSITVQGTALNVKPGDKLLIVVNGDHTVYTTFRVIPDLTTKTTRIDLQIDFFLEIGADPYELPSYDDSIDFPNGIAPATPTPLTEDTVASLMLNKSWYEKDLLSVVAAQNWAIDTLAENITEQLANPPAPGRVYVFRLSAPLFGYNASRQVVYETYDVPLFDSTGTPIQDTEGNVVYESKVRPKLSSSNTLELQEWSTASDEKSNWLFLDNAYDAITRGSYVAVDKPSLLSSTERILEVHKITATSTYPRRAYGLSGRSTRLTLDGDWPNLPFFSFEDIRSTTIYAQSEELFLTAIPIKTVIQGTKMTLDSLYLELHPGQKLILTGELEDLKGVTHSEMITLKEVIIQSGYTQITLSKALEHRYIRNTVTINANVAPATHGETVREVLGSGDASQPYQTFALRQSPLTYVSSSLTPSGALSTLQIRVNDILWHEASMLYGKQPGDRIYVTRREDDGKPIVKFGDGKTGVRLPTGSDNIEATYRKGIGLEGNVRANQLTSLLTRPLGVNGVTNPVPAAGGDAPEQMEDARQNAPLTVLTLDRVVSLRDYKDFSRAFAGVAKALATWTWMGQVRGVFLTVAGPNGATVEPNLIQNLVSQIKKSGDPHVPLQVESYRSAFFRIEAQIKIDPDFQTDSVLASVKQALIDAFSFETRAFGQGVALSEVMAVMQAVPGVVAVRVDSLKRTDNIGGNGMKSPLPAAVPQSGSTGIQAAELLILNPSSLENLGVMP